MSIHGIHTGYPERKRRRDCFILLGIDIRHIGLLYVSNTETEMVGLIPNGINDLGDFHEDVTAYKLYENHDKKLMPTSEMFHPLVSFMPFYDAIKHSLRNKADELTESIFACILAVRLKSWWQI